MLPKVIKNTQFEKPQFCSPYIFTSYNLLSPTLLRNIHLFHQVWIKVGIGDISVKEDVDNFTNKHILS